MDTMKQIRYKLKTIITEECNSDTSDSEIIDAERVLSSRTSIPLIKEDDIEQVTHHRTKHTESKHLWLQNLIDPLKDIQDNELVSLLNESLIQ